jgi:hypothetical protein
MPNLVDIRAKNGKFSKVLFFRVGDALHGRDESFFRYYQLGGHSQKIDPPSAKNQLRGSAKIRIKWRGII